MNKCACILLLVGTFAIAGCASTNPNAAKIHNVPATSAALEPLAFMAGGWIDTSEKVGRPFNEEHWMLPRGNSMMGMYRQVGADGNGRLNEVTHITASDAGVTLKLRHFHSPLDIRNNETEAQVFRLVAATGSSATFEAVEHTKGVKRVTYTANGANAIDMEIAFEDREAVEKFTMYRVRGAGE
jgi:hypothetical protein